MAKAKLHPFWNEKVKYLPFQKPLYFDRSVVISDVLTFIQKENRGCVLIVSKDQHLEGIVTERDFMNRYIGSDIKSSDPIEKIMTSDVFVLSPEEDVSTVIDLFAIKPFRHFPICYEKKIIGILSVRAFIDFIAENIPEETLNLPPILGDSPKEPFGG